MRLRRGARSADNGIFTRKTPLHAGFPPPPPCLARGQVRRIRELAEQPGNDERGLLTDVDGVVADALQAARDERHDHRPLARVGVVADLDRHSEDVAVDAIDLAILPYKVLGELDVAIGERALALDHLGARKLAHLEEQAEQFGPDRALMADEAPPR